jgi:mannan endo-1,4-beta-mannosidase
MDILQVKDNYLHDAAGNQLVLRGVNLPLLDDWDFPASNNVSEIERTGANAVRIQWYISYPSPPPPGPQRPAYTLSDLDAVLDACRINRLIPILMLADFSCADDITLVNTKLVPWWTQAAIVAVLNRHRRYIIVNLGNEVGQYRWAGSTAAALNAFRDAYTAAIDGLRGAGLQMPILVDAPDCGTTLGAFTGTSLGQDLIQHDPLKNILLSVHAYWAGYDGMAELTTNPVTAKLPIVFGEIANKQAETIETTDGAGRRVLRTEECYYDIDGKTENHPAPTGFSYQALLAELSRQDIGWLAWSWWKDACANRQMTSTGKYTDLTTYGDDLVNNDVYGLRHAVRTPTLP